LAGGHDTAQVVRVGDTVLRHLEAVGYPHAPRFRGVGAYRQGWAMLRRPHDATAGHRLAGDRECVVHGDSGPFNTIFQDGRPVAFIDWTGCAPGDRLDVAYQPEPGASRPWAPCRSPTRWPT
jgi:hypothetical protein